jgi:hypothetical protein
MVEPNPSAKRNHGGLGAGPQESISRIVFIKFITLKLNSILLFPEKEAKSVVPLRGGSWDPNLPRSGTTGV